MKTYKYMQNPKPTYNIPCSTCFHNPSWKWRSLWISIDLCKPHILTFFVLTINMSYLSQACSIPIESHYSYISLLCLDFCSSKMQQWPLKALIVSTLFSILSCFQNLINFWQSIYFTQLKTLAIHKYKLVRQQETLSKILLSFKPS